MARGSRHARRALGALAAAAAAALLAPPGAARAETAWVKDELRLNLRTGPGEKFRILRSIQTGDSVEIVSRREEWTKVRVGDEEGWIPSGYLQPEMPAARRVARLAQEAEELRAKLQALEEEAAQLRQENSSLGSSEEERSLELERLTRENMELRAGARWPELITGAAILGTGMALGAVLRRRRAGPRIRI